MTYTATDNCNNSTTGSFTITIECAICDTPPAITCPTAYTACPGSPTSPSFTGLPVASNNGSNCSGAPSLTFIDNVQGNGSCSGAANIIRTWTATDTNTGLFSNCNQSIVLQDNNLPVISNVPANITLEGSVAGCTCLLYTSPSPRDRTRYRMPSSA